MDELDEAILELTEALRRGASRKKAERLVRPLQLAMRKAFKQQGNLFVRKLRALKLKFSERALTQGEPIQAWATELNRPFNEAISENDWLAAWIETGQETLRLFSEPLDKAVAKALEVGALASMAEIGMKISWSAKNPRAKAYLDSYGAKLVAGINETTRDFLKTLLGQASEAGWSYQKTAEAISERFGEFAEGKPQEHIDSRAHLVAVTEVGNAYAEGNLQIAQELKAAGLELEKAWSTVGDDKVSEECQANEKAGWIGIGEAFPSGHQRPLRFPGCRCDLLTRVKKD
jgi:hypothetical protein